MVSRRTQAIAGLSVVGVLGAGAFASRDRYDYNQVCADQTTNTRVSDANCSTDTGYYGGLAGPRYGWYSIPTGNTNNSSIAGVGSALQGGSFSTPPADASVARGVPAAGAKISRGGFGSSSAKSSSVGG